jgi:hypothetical protein
VTFVGVRTGVCADVANKLRDVRAEHQQTQELSVGDTNKIARATKQISKKVKDNLVKKNI